MDLPTCPACGQSVIDDDAELCPFCGAAMDGSSPPTKPTGSGKPAAKKPPAAAAAGKPSAKTAPKKSSGSSDDNPFGEEEKPKVKAIPLAPRPMKNRPQEVECPMCGSTGYAPLQASGRPVRCANKTCPVPTFDAPNFNAEPEEPEPEPKKTGGISGLTYALIGTAIAIGLGIVVYFKFIMKPDLPQIATPIPQDVIDDPGDSGTPKDPSNNGTPNGVDPNGDPGTEDKPTEAEKLVKRLDTALDAMIEIVKEGRDARESLIEFRERIESTAEAAAWRGNEEMTDRYLSLLPAADSPDGYFRIDPHTVRGWSRLTAGDESGANSAADDALKATDALTKDRRAVESSIRLASLLVALDRSDEANALLRQRSDIRSVSQRPTPAQIRLASDIQIARAIDGGNLASAVRLSPPIPSDRPAWLAVIADLVRHNQTDAALSFATAQPEGTDRAEAIATWGRAMLGRGDVAPETILGSLTAPLGSLSSAGRAYVRAVIGSELVQTDQTEAADPILTAARTDSDAATEADPLPLRVGAAYFLANAAAWRGDSERSTTLLKQAVETARQFESTPLINRETILGDLFARAATWPNAAAVWRAIEDDSLRASAGAAFAPELAATGETSLQREAIAAARSANGQEAALKQRLATELVGGDMERAARAIDDVSADGTVKERLLLETVARLIETDRSGEAFDLATEVSEGNGRLEASAAVATQMVTTDQLSAALELLEKPRPSDVRLHFRYGLVRGVALRPDLIETTVATGQPER